MAKGKEKAQTVDTSARKRMAKKLGIRKLKAIEGVFLKEEIEETAILETSARANLLKKLGKANLEMASCKAEYSLSFLRR
jgi:hypothetical protein